MKTIGIINAGDAELAPYLDTLEISSETQMAMLRFYDCRYEGHRIITLFSGVCKVNAAIAAQILIDRFQVDGILNSGTCGGLDENIKVFDTIAATACVYHDVEDTILTEFHPWIDSPYFPSDPVLLEKLKRLSLSYPMHCGVIATGEYFVESEEQRLHLRRRYPSVLGIDMESCAIAHACYVNAVPFLSVRTVTDNAQESGLENFEQNIEKASRISMEICLKLVKNL